MALLLVAGCGGQGGVRTSRITGTVTDINGNPAREARVTADGAVAFTTVTGVYTISGVRAADLLVRAEINQDGALYRGENVARTFPNEPTQNVNIVVAPTSQLASLEGTVTDRAGRRIQGASVFALAGGLSSSRAITDRNGRYSMGGLVAGFQYTVSAGGSGYRSDETSVLLSGGERRTMDFVLSDAGPGGLPPPANVDAVAWTSPASGRSERGGDAYENLKRLFDPRRVQMPRGRDTAAGNPIEIDVFWDPVQSTDLLGYGVYRARADAGPYLEHDFLRDPLAGAYVDLDPAILQNTAYFYRLTSLDTRFPQGVDSESGFSSSAAVVTLGDLQLDSIRHSPLTFRWLGGSGAQSYIVFLFDRFPGIGVSSFWDTISQRTSNLQQPYTGPGLQVGRRYYYLVLGLANSDRSRTISVVGEFIYAG